MTLEQATGKFIFYFKDKGYQEMVTEQASRVLWQIYSNHEAQLKAKDEEIERLKADELGKLLQESYIDSLEKQSKKARQIVAMLYWEWKQAYLNCLNLEEEFSCNGEYDDFLNRLNSDVEARMHLFNQAYKMLKD